MRPEDYQNLPVQLTGKPNFCLYKIVPVPGKRPKKIPYHAITLEVIKGERKESDCVPFDVALKALAENPQYHGLGYFLKDESCLDIDGASRLNGVPSKIVQNLSTWGEYSQSGDGIHLFMLGKIPPYIKTLDYQLYQAGQFIALTGKQIEGTPGEIADCTQSFARVAELAGLKLKAAQTSPAEITPALTSPAETSHNAPETAITYQGGVTDSQVIEQAFKAKNGKKIRAIYDGDNPSGDASVDDMALLGLLRPYTEAAGGNAQLERIFRNSPRFDDRPHNWPDYIARTIKAVTSQAAGFVYNWQHQKTKPKQRKYNPTDYGNAERFVDAYGDSARYVHKWGVWLIWNGKHWERNETGAAERLAKKVARSIYHDAAKESDDDKRKAIVKHAAKTESAAGIRNMLALATSEPEIPITNQELDAGDFLLNVENGTVDLTTGAIRQHHKADYLTRLLPIRYSPKAECPNWIAFLSKIMGDDETMIAYLQRAIGYSLTGNAGEQCLFFLHGHGSNGKSTFIETLTTLLGDFSVKTPIESLLVKKGGGGIPNDLARLNGVRLVTASEVDDGNRLNESLVKDLTGGDTISARFLHGEFFDFKPIFKLWMFGNHKPIIRGTDKGMWRRVHLIEFGVTISPDEKDRLLPEKLRNELPGILAWAVQGCLNWQKEGLNPPPKVLKATAEYQAEMDILGVFISERCTIGDGLKASAKELYAAYKTWALDSGEFVATQRRFGQSLTERGFQRVRKTDGIWWHGITVSVDSDMNTAGGGETEI